MSWFFRFLLYCIADKHTSENMSLSNYVTNKAAVQLVPYCAPTKLFSVRKHRSGILNRVSFVSSQEQECQADFFPAWPSLATNADKRKVNPSQSIRELQMADINRQLHVGRWNPSSCQRLPPCLGMRGILGAGRLAGSGCLRTGKHW